MHVAVFSSKPYDRRFLEAANEAQGHPHEFTFFEAHLTGESSHLAAGFPAVCAFVNDELSAAVLRTLAAGGTRFIAMRSAGFNNVELATAAEVGITVARVPAYSPYAVAEHAVGLILALNRKLPWAYNRVREGNFSLEGLLGFDLHGRTVGIIGTGTIGTVFARIMHGFGCHLVAYDPYPSVACKRMGVWYMPLADLLGQADIVSLHLPLTPSTHHLIDDAAIFRMKEGAMLINTSRGALVDTNAAIAGLKVGQLGALGLDVYEEEADLFFEDLSAQVIQDDIFARLLTFPNVLITGHQGFFTEEALTNIAETTLANLTALECGTGVSHLVTQGKG